MVSCGASPRSLRVGEVMLTGEIIPSGGITLFPLDRLAVLDMGDPDVLLEVAAFGGRLAGGLGAASTNVRRGRH